MSKSDRGTTAQREALRKACFRMWGRSCMICGDRATEVDHIIELAAGGTNTVDNTQPLCKPCHQAKTSQFNRSRSRRSPTEPRRGVFLHQLAPTDSLMLLSPRLTVFEPPMAERPKS